MTAQETAQTVGETEPCPTLLQALLENLVLGLQVVDHLLSSPVEESNCVYTSGIIPHASRSAARYGLPLGSRVRVWRGTALSAIFGRHEAGLNDTYGHNFKPFTEGCSPEVQAAGPKRVKR